MNKKENLVPKEGGEMKGHWLYEFTDETSAYDPKGSFCTGSDCYLRKYRIWVPDSIRPDDLEAIADYIDRNSDRREVWA